MKTVALSVPTWVIETSKPQADVRSGDGAVLSIGIEIRVGAAALAVDTRAAEATADANSTNLFRLPMSSAPSVSWRPRAAPISTELHTRAYTRRGARTESDVGVTFSCDIAHAKYLASGRSG